MGFEIERKRRTRVTGEIDRRPRDTRDLHRVWARRRVIAMRVLLPAPTGIRT